MKNKKLIMPTVVLSVICIVVALVLSVLNIFTDPVIKEAEKEKEQEALRSVIPDGENFREVDFSGFELDGCIKKVYEEDGGGLVFRCEVVGYKSGLVIMVGVGNDGKIIGSKCIESSETNGAEKTLKDEYDGKDKDTLDVEIVAGSTKTSVAYHKAIESSLLAREIIKGGSEK